MSNQRNHLSYSNPDKTRRSYPGKTDSARLGEQCNHNCAIERSLQAMQRERSQLKKTYEKAKAEQEETHRAAVRQAREEYNNRLRASREEIKHKQTSEIEKKDQLLELERKAKDQLDSKLRNLESKFLAAVESSEKANVSKENDLEAKYRQTMSDLMERIEVLADENGDLKAKLSASQRVREAAVTEARKEVEGLRKEVKKARGLMLTYQREAERSKKVQIYSSR
ncbi:hypothetical protein AAMO2058_000916800 [Amorphochlora amoebiformis]